MSSFPPFEQRHTLPAWIKDEDSKPIIYGTAWTSSGSWLFIASVFVYLHITKPAGAYLWVLAPCALLLVLMGLYQRVWLTHTGIAWRTLRGKAWVHWNEIDSVTEVVGNRFVPVFKVEGRTLFLPIEEAALQKVRCFMASRPSRGLPLDVPSYATASSGNVRMATLFFTFSLPLIMSGKDSGNAPFGLTNLHDMMLIFGLMMAGFSVLMIVQGLPARWLRTVEITEEGLTSHSGKDSRSIKFSEVRRAELIGSVGSSRYLTLESVSSGFSLPYEMADFDRWKDAIAARLPEGVVIK